MGNLSLKIILFNLIVIGFYTYYANSIPQIESKPPEEITIGAEMSPEELISAGEKVFYGKGGCAVCHSIGEKGLRCPDLQGVGARAATRVPGKSSTAYLVESLTNPQAYLVEGYGDIMPKAHKPPISLNQTELLATVAFLQNLGGEVTVKLTDIPAQETATAEASKEPVIKGNPEDGKKIFSTKECIICHTTKDFKLAAMTPLAMRGPDLSSIAAINTMDYIEESVLNPDAKTVSGFKPGTMPKYFAEKLTVKEFNDIVAYLLTQK